MIRDISILTLFLITTAYAQVPIGTQNRVLMVDQDGRINIPAVLATQAQLSTNAAAVAIAEAKAEAADRAAREGTNMVAEVIQQIGANELVIYREGLIDSITSDIVLPPDTKLTVRALRPMGRAPNGRDVYQLDYATTRPADGIDPDVLHADTLAGGRDAMMPLAVDRIGPVTRLSESYTSPDGTVFPHSYRVDIQLDPSPSGFFLVNLSGDASADGSVFEISGGIAGGATAEVPCGSKTLVFRGGLLVEVRQ